MRRGDVLIVSMRGYTGKPRPAVVVQSDAFYLPTSVVICPMSSEDVGATFLRPLIEPDSVNNLKERSWIMVDKIGAIEPSRIGRRIGALLPEQMRMVDHRLAVFLGLAGDASRTAWPLP